MNNLKSRLGIDDKLTKVRPTPKRFSKLKDNIPLHEDFNYMADLMFLPTDRLGYKYLLVCVDLASDEFDMQELKSKTPEAVLKGFEKIFARPYLNKPEYSLTTDAGTEFQGVMKKWLYDESIFHKITVVGRHKQLGNIDSLIRQLSTLFIGLANEQEKKSGKISKAWLKHIPIIRKVLNKVRKKELPKNYMTHIYPSLTTHKKGKLIKQKFKVGDMVHVALDRPEDARGKKQTGKFRIGDNRYSLEPKRIKQVVYYPGPALHRYIVYGINNVSYTEGELLKA